MRPFNRYLIDSNVLIEAHRHYYAFNLCPGFWDSLIWLHGCDRVFSLDKVKNEIAGENDELAGWAVDVMPAAGFLSSQEDAVVEWFAKMQVWAQAQFQYSDAAKEEFALVADAWLIAYARAHGLTLVTQEQYKPNVKRRIPIPNVCKAFNVPYANTFEMLTALSIRYGWSAPE